MHLCSPYLSRLAMAAGYAMAGVSAMTRVQQGAHFTGDAVGGAFLGVAVASMLRLICGRSQRSWFERSPA